jgi:cytoskeleton protein RodZ
MNVGLELRHARERRGLSLLQLSKTTKISQRVLDAIETCDDAHLPAPVFTRSFVRTYAAEVGLDPDDTWCRYLEQFEPLPIPADVEPVPAPSPEADARDEPALASKTWEGARILYGRFGTATVMVLVGIAALVLAGRNYRQSHDEPTPQANGPAVTAAGLMPAALPAQQPVGTSGSAAGSADELQLTIEPTGPCWVQATVNGERVLATLLGPGDRRTVESASDVTLRVGDAAAFAFSINGKHAKVPGTPGQAVTIRVTKENYQQFLVRL